MGDVFFIGCMFFAVATPVFWIVLFFLLRKSRIAKVTFWISFTIYLIMAAVGAVMLNNASGWDGIGVAVIGGMIISVYTLLAFIVLLILRKKFNGAKIIQEREA